jgi:hypothetical protein
MATSPNLKGLTPRKKADPGLKARRRPKNQKYSEKLSHLGFQLNFIMYFILKRIVNANNYILKPNSKLLD